MLKAVSVLLGLFVLFEVNYPVLAPQSRLALFALLGLNLAVLLYPTRIDPWGKWWDRFVQFAVSTVCLYMVVCTEPLFGSFWPAGVSLGNRAGAESETDTLVGIVGTLVVLEVTRRCLGWILPLLASAFVAYALFGPLLPSWLLPHRGYGPGRVAAQTFLQSQGIFGIALEVIFSYVFLFVLLGVALEMTGATRFVLGLAQRLLGGSSGGSAKVAVLSSGMLGSLSGSAVANTATTGTFTIPMMRSAGFSREVAAGVEAAASTGGALVPPVMGAAAYMMLEMVDPPVTYLQIVKAAIVPSVLYYLSLLFFVHFYARRRSSSHSDQVPSGARFAISGTEGLVFWGSLFTLIVCLVWGFTPFRAVTVSLMFLLLIAAFDQRTRLGPRRVMEMFVQTAKAGVPLITAGSCVGIIIGVVTLTGMGTMLPALILPLAQKSLVLALFMLMVSSIILGMGLPSVVCYLLLATFVGSALTELGVVPLAAHFFIFYYGMMSMVTPPVALAAYAAAGIAGANVMRSSWAGFRFAFVGFTLPFMFVIRPQLMLLRPDGSAASMLEVIPPILVALAGILAFAAGLAGFLFNRLSIASRIVLFGSAGLLLFPAHDWLFSKVGISWTDLTGALLLAGVAWTNRIASTSKPSARSAPKG